MGRAENPVETAHKRAVAAAGGVARKWVSPQFRGVPDQIDLYGVAHMVPVLERALDQMGLPPLAKDRMNALCKAMLKAAIQFTECKAPNGVVEAHQERRHDELRARGFTVNIRSEK